MPIYTVHEPPPQAAGAPVNPERLVFVRDGFYVWGFLLTPFWLLWHRLWLVLCSYLIIVALLDGVLRFYGASGAVVMLVGILVSLLIGLEAAPLRRFTLRRRGWRSVGLVSGYDLEDAERRFFEGWVRTAPSQSPPPSMPPTGVPPYTPGPAADPSGVIGLFPEPGAQR